MSTNLPAAGIDGRIFALFADLFSYPRAGLTRRIASTLELLSRYYPEASAAVERFRAYAAEMPPGQLEECYTAAFDLQGTCYPYVSYHLFGESYRRAAFLSLLNEEYRRYNYSPESEFDNELPDHLAVVLRFLSSPDTSVGSHTEAEWCHSEPERSGGEESVAPLVTRKTQNHCGEPLAELRHDLITCCLLPAVARMAGALGGGGTPYGDVLRALLLALRSAYQEVEPEQQPDLRHTEVLPTYGEYRCFT